MKKYLVVIATLFLVFFINLNAVSAQDTSKPQEPAKPQATQPAQTGSDDFQKATSVFLGQVVQVNRKENDPNATIKFTVQKIWKGKSAKEMKVSTTKDSGNCVDFEVGKTYTVYTSEINGKNQINCSKTTLSGAAISNQKETPKEN